MVIAGCFPLQRIFYVHSIHVSIDRVRKIGRARREVLPDARQRFVTVTMVGKIPWILRIRTTLSKIANTSIVSVLFGDLNEPIGPF